VQHPLVENHLIWVNILSTFIPVFHSPSQKRLGMKTKIVSLIGLLLLVTQVQVFAGNNDAVVNENLLKAFKAAFPHAEKVDWKDNGAEYFVHFSENAVTSEIEYDHEGNFISSERFYTDAGLLPLHLAWEIHKKFGDKTVFGISETNDGEETLYFVKLQDSKQWMTVEGSADGIIMVTEKFEKQKD
jgi:hypothetical protein